MVIVKPDTRLILSVVMIIGSALYGMLLLEAPKFAEAIAVGYIAVLLTILTITNLWRRS